ncbi:tripartite tricarboxylate transporter TctB family protein [Roseomonas aerophila]|uniref:Tripartite tricarboxylate transporter TctB family protein n=1 Tax=Teichococcus aerophilus TaxID=1224513 RepID=A0ABR7RGH4_9PROT|nr:tripartite tricarboxylate transporter TctB family protein [Pseudoroseomonas aerophila]MBC9205664.1 tripartite tricarboxylate transporter TctB family protein [Pseudoroseomonas aerophila]
MLTRFHLELIFAACVFAIGAVGLYGSLELDTGWASDGPQAGFFPFRVALILMAGAVLVAIQAVRARAKLRPIAITDRAGMRRILWFGLPIIGMVALAQWLGLYVAMAVYLLATIRLGGRRPWHTSLGVAAGVTLVTFVVFEWWFQVPLLKGPLEIMLGLA